MSLKLLNHGCFRVSSSDGLFCLFFSRSSILQISSGKKIKNLANLFSKNFHSEALAEYVICLPVTKNLSESAKSVNFGILPADLVIEVLQERQNLNKETRDNTYVI